MAKVCIFVLQNLCILSEVDKDGKFCWHLRKDYVIIHGNLLSTALTAGRDAQAAGRPPAGRLLWQVQGFLLDLWKRGERMSLEAIAKIRAAEESTEQSKADARSQAQRLAADAEREGRALLQQGREKAAAAAADAMRRAEEQAAVLRDQILAQAEKDCNQLRADASARMDKAAQAILGRVVES